MRILYCYLISVLIAVIVISGCSGDNTLSSTGGGTSETTNGRVALSDGTSASCAKVLIIDKKNWYSNYMSGSSVVIESTYTNHKGEFSIGDYSDLLCNIQIGEGDEALFIDGFTDSMISSSVLELDETGTITLSSAISGNSDVRLYGTAYQEVSEEEKETELNNIASGEYMILSLNSSDYVEYVSVVQVSPGESVPAGPSPVSTEELLIDDFETLDSVGGLTRIGLITGVYWYSFRDTEPGVEAWLERSIENTPDNRYYRMKAVLREETFFSWAGIGTGLYTKPMDFSNFEGVSFKARGNGVIRMTIENADVDSLTGGLGQYGKNYTLKESFEEVSIPFDSLQLPEGDFDMKGYGGVSELIQNVSRLEFTFHKHLNPAGDTLRADIDDVKFYGAGMNEFLMRFEEVK